MEFVAVTIECVLEYQERSKRKSEVFKIGKGTTVRDALERVTLKYGDEFRVTLFEGGEKH